MFKDNDFLAFTLANPHGAAPAAFTTDTGIEVALWDTGILCLTPANPGNKDIVLSCGVHGNETAPIEIVRDLAKAVLDGSLPLAHRLLLLIGNPPAINAGKREIEENLNRLFSGAHSKGDGQNAERERAKALEAAVARFYHERVDAQRSDALRQEALRLHYDLHTAIRGSQHEKFVVYPFLHGKPRSKEQVMFLAECGVDTVLLSDDPTTTFSYFSTNEFAAHGFTVELGKVRPFGQNDMSRFKATADTLAKLVSQRELVLPAYDESRLNLYRISRVINKQSDSFAFTFGEDVENFTTYPKGHLLATDGAIEHRVELDAEAVIFPNARVAVGQRACLLVARTQLD
ncbi:MAG: succinylglutamate desuccinylase [Pseudomonadota bacterium]|uniref:succinylglutamate desuccinylase n=1 Tax=Gallaecimonas pentaromativorans TaxID=584787 RepID=UPI00067F5A73|nr:succinylglutamate desuccinylase [Gallaecimonas pentaromativorans]MED5525996.1 succinylglutamate desuccinylase [Pseudomonadota bacterium]